MYCVRACVSDVQNPLGRKHGALQLTFTKQKQATESARPMGCRVLSLSESQEERMDSNNFLFVREVTNEISSFPTIHNIKEIIYMPFESSINNRKIRKVQIKQTLCKVLQIVT